MNDNELLFKPFHTFGDYIIVEYLGGGGMAVVHKAIPRSFIPLNFLELGVYHTPLGSWAIFFIVIIIVAACVLISPIFTPTMMIRITIVLPLGCVVLVRLFLIRWCINRKAVSIKIPLFEHEEYIKRLEGESKALIATGDKICKGVMKFYVPKLGRKLSCIAMEYIPYQDLSDIIEKKKLSIREIVNYTIGICEALSVLHNEGIIHRDIKPEHIKVDSSGKVYILDLGIAIVTGRTRITRFGDIPPGTRWYMSPEQTYPNQTLDRLDYRSDIYSLGIVLFEMIEGKVPFNSTSSEEEIIHKHRNTPPPEIKNPDCPKKLKEVVEKALKKERADRYSSAQEMADDLTAVLESLNN